MYKGSLADQNDVEMKKKTKLLFITGSRGEWGYIRPILKLCQKTKNISYKLCATNMHLLSTFGMSRQEIENDGFTVDHTVYMALDGYNHHTMTKSLGIFLMSLSDILAGDTPDWIVLAGDRGEQLMGAIAGAHCRIPVAHIQAGELSGNIDGMTRHAIGKYAHIHFAANQDAADRLVRLGEEPFRVHMVGAPQLDELVEGACTPLAQIRSKYGIHLLVHDYILVVLHPVTEQFNQAAEQVAVMMSALRKINRPKVIIMPNNDAGSLHIREGIQKNKHGVFHVFANVKREDYLGLMKNCSCMVGNSSSGLLEAPTFKVPAVNIGRRQTQRVRTINVIDTEFDKKQIIHAVNKAVTDKFHAELEANCVNPYGDGRSAHRILKVLENTPVDDALLNKNLTY
jgi:GDP/UDP-N,N'-diacetylbacillosamine 2-epimerase (hydrolysing)